MRKTTLQAIINIFAICLFVVFLVIYSNFRVKSTDFSAVWFGAFLVLCVIICFSKFLLYKRQNFLYFSLVFLMDFVLVILYKDKFDILIKNNFGWFFVVLGIVAFLIYMRYKERYQLKLGMICTILGAVLLMIFGKF